MKEEYRDIAPCPKCGAPGEYTYTIEWPGDGDNDKVVIMVDFRCAVCGYSITGKRVVIPVRALYLLKGLLAPKVRPFVEKVFLASNISLEDSP